MTRSLQSWPERLAGIVRATTDYSWLDHPVFGEGTDIDYAQWFGRKHLLVEDGRWPLPPKWDRSYTNKRLLAMRDLLSKDKINLRFLWLNKESIGGPVVWPTGAIFLNYDLLNYHIENGVMPDFTRKWTKEEIIAERNAFFLSKDYEPPLLLIGDNGYDIV